MPDRDVVGHEVAADRQDARPERRALVEHREVDRARADVGDGDAQLLLRLVRDGLGRGERVDDELVDLDARLGDALHQVLDRGRGRGDDVGLDLEPQGAHPERVLDALLAVDREAAPLDVEDLAVGRDRDRPGLLDRAPDVVAADLAVVGGDGDLAGRVEALDLRAADADEGLVDLPAGQPLGPLDRVRDGADGLLDVDDRAPLEARTTGTVPWPMTVSRPSRPISPMSAQTLLVPTSRPTRTASLPPSASPSLPQMKCRRMRATLLKIRRPKVISATRYRSRPSRSPMNVRITATIALVTNPLMKIRLS